MANESKTPIVPFIITGEYKIFSSSITIEFLPPKEITDHLEEENNELRKKIDKKLEDHYERNQSD